MQKENKNFIFFGTPDVAKKTLEILKENGYMPSCIVTSPDAPAGRGMIQTATPVSIWAEENFIDCIKPTAIDDEFINTISEYNADLFIVVAYGKILPEQLIKLPKLETINIHYSLLPKYRGASPVEQALLNGDEVTGVSIQQMALKMDAGDIISELEVPIDITDTKSTLREKLINRGGELLVSILPDIFNKKIILTKQDDTLTTRCKKIKKEDGLIDINGNDRENYNKYRAYENWPSVFFMKDNKRIKITKAVFSDKKFVIIKVIPEGKKEVDYNIFNK